MSGGTDISESEMLSYSNHYVDVYSNSWGPSDFGFTVGGPGPLARSTFEESTAQVSIFRKGYLATGNFRGLAVM